MLLVNFSYRNSKNHEHRGRDRGDGGDVCVSGAYAYASYQGSVNDYDYAYVIYGHCGGDPCEKRSGR